jgi:hypothetical protein
LGGVIFQHLLERRYFVQASSEDIPPRMLDAASRKFPEFTYNTANFRSSVDDCALTHLHVFIINIAK